MQYERINNTKRNLIFGMILKVYTLIMPFVIRIFIVRYLGGEYVGLSGLFTSILNVLCLTEMGFASAVTFALYEPIARGDNGKVWAILQFFKKVYERIAIAVFAMGIGVIPFLKLIVREGCPENINLYILYFIFLLNSLTIYLFGSYKRALVAAYQRSDIVSKITLYVQIGIYTAQLVVLFFAKNYYAYAVLILVGNILVNIILSICVDKQYKFEKKQDALAEEDRSRIFNKVKGLICDRLSSTIRTSANGIFITAIMGVWMNAVYGNYLVVIAAITGILAMFTSSILGGIGNGIVLYDKEKNYSDFMAINNIYMVFISFVTIGMFAFYQLYVEISYGQEYVAEGMTVVAFCALFFVMSSTCARNAFIDATGLWDKTKKYLIMSAVVNIILNYAGVKLWGIAGGVFATVITLVIFDGFFLSVVLFTEVFEKKKMIQYFLYQLFFSIITIISCITVYVTSHVSVKPFVSEGLSFLAGLILFVGFLTVFGFKSKLFKKSIGLLLKVVGIKK